MRYSEFNHDWSDMELQYSDTEMYIYCDGIMIGKVSRQWRYLMSTHYEGFELLPIPVAVKLFADMAMLAETPLAEREDPKLYRVKFPAITRGGNSIYLARNTGRIDPIGIDWSSKDYIVDDFPDNYMFTEKELKDINGSYWELAEEVEG